MATRKENIRLSELEWEVLKPLWERGPLPARELYEILGQQQGWAYKTLKTMLARLVAKGALSYRQIGNSYLYSAAVSREQMTTHAVRNVVERLFDGALHPFVAHFATHVSDQELKVLQAELRRIALERKTPD